jgi:hypothetical protein
MSEVWGLFNKNVMLFRKLENIKETKYSGVCYNERCYNERCYNERMQQRTVFINIIRMLQSSEMLKRTRRNTIGRRGTGVRMTCQAFPL